MSDQIISSKRIKWTLELIQAEALKYTNRKSFEINSTKAFDAARYRGILKDVCIHMSYERKTWTLDEIKSEAVKYKTKSEFAENNKSAYEIARKMGKLDFVCLHMTDKRGKKWTVDEIKKEAAKHQNREVFKKTNSKAYDAARVRGILQDVCAHMEYSTSVSDNDSIYIWKSDIVFNDMPVYKIGITSNRLGDMRIKEVSQRAGVSAEIIELRKVNCKATLVENKLKKIGTFPKLEKFDGYSEFRAMTDEQLKQAINIIRKAA